MSGEVKIINDPVFGFISIPRGLLLDVMQRLTRIRQNGLASMVYPGAQHTRFLHSLGAYHLTRETVLSLMQKGVFIFDSEAEAVQAAILMHDIGHGPFSHVLEHTLISGISHEEISLLMMERMNREMEGKLSLAIKIFKDEYPKRFLHQLISSQLDMDRMDYLRRDCFFTGVTEGNIGSARIIKMLNVVDDHLVVEYKGIYSIENFLTSRRLMYWQVYYHKTVVACEKMLVGALLRAKQLFREGRKVFASPALRYFLSQDVDATTFKDDEKALRFYAMLDDSDIWSALKVWEQSDDRLLALLSGNLLNRQTFRVEVSDEPFDANYVEDIRKQLQLKYELSSEETDYLVSETAIQKDMYSSRDESIEILYKDGTTHDVSEASELLTPELINKKIRKYYLCYQRV